MPTLYSLSKLIPEITKVSVWVIILMLVFRASINAQVIEVKILANNGVSADRFGYSVSLDGDFLIAGSPKYQNNTGTAYIFHRSGNNWTQQDQLLANDGSASDEFGCSVSISGSYCIIGAHQDSDNGTYSGSAYIFKNNNGNWQQEAKILANDGEAFNEFGYAVSIYGDYVIVGVPYDNTQGNSAGAAYIFQRSGSNWLLVGKKVASDANFEYNFGYSVHISSSYAIVGSPGWGENYPTDIGAAFVFIKTGSDWIEQAKLISSDGAPHDRLGYSVAISTDYAVLGCPNDDDYGNASGAVYVFKRNGTTWEEEPKVNPDDNTAEDLFGWSVSLSGSVICAGAIGRADNGTGSGAAYIFSRSGSDWIQKAKLVASDGGDYDNLGESASISGSYCVIGADWDDNSNGQDAGSAYIYNNFISDVNDQISTKVQEFSLSENYPNPFNPGTNIEYKVPQTSDVIIKVFDILGKEIETLVNERRPAGTYEVTWDAGNLPSGIYFYQIKAGDPSTGSGQDFVETKKMILLK